MAFPVIKFNSSTGSDTLASGAGPATSLHGTQAATSGDGLTVDLSADSPDLSGVATDGTAVIFVVDDTADKRNFARITGVDNTAKTVTVAEAYQFSQSGLGWAIGGKRATLDNSYSRKLATNGGVVGDAMPGWTIEFADGDVQLITANIAWSRSGDTSIGPITLQGEPNAVVRPVLSSSVTNNYFFTVYGEVVTFMDFDIKSTVGSFSRGIDFQATGTARHIRVAPSDTQNNNFITIFGISNGGYACVEMCEVTHCRGSGIVIANHVYSARVIGNYIHGCAGHGIEQFTANTGYTMRGIIITDNVIVDNAGRGVDIDSRASSEASLGDVHIERNTICHNGSDGLFVSKTAGLFCFCNGRVLNNILSGNGGYGLNFGGGLNAVAIETLRMLVANNCFGSGSDTYGGVNASGTVNPADVALQDCVSIDPVFTDAAGGDFRVGPALAGLGWPLGDIGYSATGSSVDIGVSQRAAGGGGGGLLVNPGMAGGMRG